MYIKQMIKIMREQGAMNHSGFDKRLRIALNTLNGDLLEEEVSNIFADWTIFMPVPETKNEYIKYLESKDMEWQSWTEPKVDQYYLKKRQDEGHMLGKRN